jgi:hypothetical protein
MLALQQGGGFAQQAPRQGTPDDAMSPSAYSE